MRKLFFTILSGLFLTLMLVALIFVWRSPDLGRLADVSQVLRGDGQEIINLRLTNSGHWREPAQLERIDPQLIKMLIAYEDKRFWQHFGVDPLAVMRAAISLAKSGKIKSGASTLTMQTVKLMHPELRKRSFKNKLSQMAEAIRLEAHWSKEEILEAYFTLAPYGGNIEGIEAATEAWFQKSPSQLTFTEAALLVALPQSPERRRPDLFPDAAFEAKSKVLEVIKDRIGLDPKKLEELKKEPLPVRLSKTKSISPHLADRLHTKAQTSFKTTINPSWQRELLSILRTSAKSFEKPINLAALVVERRSGLVKAYVGSSSYMDVDRKGAINYLRTLRSPGSTLKPLIYANALERQIIDEGHIFNDSQFQRGAYTPANFDKKYNGKVTLKEALNRSLNISAIETLEMIGAEQFENKLRTFISEDIGQTKNAGLSLAVGGFYLSPEKLSEIYLEMADPGFNSQLKFTYDDDPTQSSHLINSNTSEQILRLMSQRNHKGKVEVFKTGTSHNRQDAWVANIFENHLVIVWLGTPDNENTQILTGRSAALPISNNIKLALGLIQPKIKQDYKIEAKNSFPPKKCSKLIQYPENGEWIRGTNLAVSVSGNSEAEWYINSTKLSGIHNQITLKNEGINKITAVLGECRETNEIFFQNAVLN
mgnify:FL=1